MAQTISWTTGEKITANKLNAISEKVSMEMRDTLIALLQHVAYTTSEAHEYFESFRQAWELDDTISRITAVYTQNGNVYSTDTLSSLRNNLVVTAYYENNISNIVDTYNLSGELQAGISTITVTYAGVSTTFNVTVTSGTSPS